MERKLHFLSTCAALLLFAIPLKAQTTLYDNGFEGTDEDTYNLTTSSGGDVNFGNLNAGSDYILRGNPATNTYLQSQPTNYSGNILMWEDFDGYLAGGELQITTNSIDISAYGNIDVSLKIGTTNNAVSNRYETADYIVVEYELDNSGSWVKIGDFRGEMDGSFYNFFEDDDLNGTFTVRADNNMRTVTYNLDTRAGSSVTGASMKVRIRTFSGVQEEMVIDDLRVVGNTVLSTNEFSLENTITLSPNPIQEDRILNINNNSQYTITSIEVYDVIGKKVYSTDTVTERIQFPNAIPSGMYFVKITDNKSNSITKKIILK